MGKTMIALETWVGNTKLPNISLDFDTLPSHVQQLVNDFHRRNDSRAIYTTPPPELRSKLYYLVIGGDLTRFPQKQGYEWMTCHKHQLHYPGLWTHDKISIACSSSIIEYFETHMMSTETQVFVSLESRPLQDGFSPNEITYYFGYREERLMSSYVHSAFNYEAGDTYGWPIDNMTPEQLDELYGKGQRRFVLMSSTHEYMVTIIVDDPVVYHKRQSSKLLADETLTINLKKAELLDDLLECDVSTQYTLDEYKQELKYIRDELKRLNDSRIIKAP